MPAIVELREWLERMKNLVICKADLHSATHQRDIVDMMDAYSRDPMGDAKPLSDYARENLIAGLITHRLATVFLAYDSQVALGIAACFRGFSTFAAKPTINLSDFYVDPQSRGRGIGKSLLEAVEKEARSIGCCKLTLEVQQNNPIARTIYERYGFAQAVYAADAESGGSMYMVKSL